MRDFRFDNQLKVQLDQRVEQDTLRTLERQCNTAKQKRQSYLQQSKRYAGSSDSMSNDYL